MAKDIFQKYPLPLFTSFHYACDFLDSAVRNLLAAFPFLVLLDTHPARCSECRRRLIYCTNAGDRICHSHIGRNTPRRFGSRSDARTTDISIAMISLRCLAHSSSSLMISMTARVAKKGSASNSCPYVIRSTSGLAITLISVSVILPSFASHLPHGYLLRRIPISEVIYSLDFFRKNTFAKLAQSIITCIMKSMIFSLLYNSPFHYPVHYQNMDSIGHFVLMRIY